RAGRRDPALFSVFLARRDRGAGGAAGRGRPCGGAPGRSDGPGLVDRGGGRSPLDAAPRLPLHHELPGPLARRETQVTASGAPRRRGGRGVFFGGFRVEPPRWWPGKPNKTPRP